jgi:hypothetical protein
MTLFGPGGILGFHWDTSNRVMTHHEQTANECLRREKKALLFGVYRLQVYLNLGSKDVKRILVINGLLQ